MSGAGTSRSGPSQSRKFRGVAARDAFEFGLRKLLRDRRSRRPLRRQTEYSPPRISRSSRRRARALLQRNVGREADSALAWPAHRGMKHAIADEHLHAPAVQRNGNVDRDFLAGDISYSGKRLLRDPAFWRRFRIALRRIRKHSILIDDGRHQVLRMRLASAKAGLFSRARDLLVRKFRAPVYEQRPYDARKGSVSLVEPCLPPVSGPDKFVHQQPGKPLRIVPHHAILVQQVSRNDIRVPFVQFPQARADGLRALRAYRRRTLVESGTRLTTTQSKSRRLCARKWPVCGRRRNTAGFRPAASSDSRCRRASRASDGSLRRSACTSRLGMMLV